MREQCVQVTIEVRGGIAERGAPQCALLLGIRAIDIEGDYRAPPCALPVSAADDHEPAHLVDETGRRARPHAVRTVHLVAVEEERAGVQQCLALPEPNERVDLDGGGREYVGGDRERIEAQCDAGRRGDAALTRRVAPAELDDGPGGIAAEAPPGGDDAIRRRLMRRYEFSDGGQRVDQARQARVAMTDAGEVVHDALVDAERAEGERRARADLDQSPMPQRRDRGEGAPMRTR